MPRPSLNTISLQLTKALRDGLSQRAKRRIGQAAVDIIVERTRRGRGVDETGGLIKPLKKLSDKYKKYRKKNIGLLDRTTKPSKSNLTFRGILLRSMTVKGIKLNSVIIGPNRKRRKGGITNEKLGDFVSQARPFNNLSKRELEKVRKFVDLEISKALKKSGF